MKTFNEYLAGRDFTPYLFFQYLSSQKMTCLLRYEIRTMFEYLGWADRLTCNKEIVDGWELNCIIPNKASGLNFAPIPIEAWGDDLKKNRWRFYENAYQIAQKIYQISNDL